MGRCASVNSKMKSSVMGILSGLVSRAEFPQGKEPVAFLYGEDKVMLPKLPEWDREAYPVACIADYDVSFPLAAHKTILWCFARNPIIYTTDSGSIAMKGDTEGIPNLKANLVDGAWETPDPTYLETLEAHHSATAPIWTNTTLHYEDGTVYLAASEPVPVYE